MTTKYNNSFIMKSKFSSSPLMADVGKFPSL